MIWYRYWLETRQRFLLLALWTIWMGAQVPDFAHPTRRAQEMMRTPLAQAIGREDAIVWEAFADKIGSLAWVAATFAFLGTGLRTAWLPRDLAVYYTLTLPVSRWRLIATYQGASCVGALLAFALMLATQCVVLLIQERSVPLVPLAISIAFAIPMLMAWTAVVGALALLTHEYWAMLMTVPILLLTVPITRHTVTAFSERGERPWIAVAALLAVTVLAFAFTLQHARIKEF
ncbi:MAG: hypothetical protein LAO55_13455 [Acidobacteriia bacterium]|nr:hypothetical protein [Terriglobia bacterium]